MGWSIFRMLFCDGSAAEVAYVYIPARCPLPLPAALFATAWDMDTVLPVTPVWFALLPPLLRCTPFAAALCMFAPPLNTRGLRGRHWFGCALVGLTDERCTFYWILRRYMLIRLPALHSYTGLTFCSAACPGWHYHYRFLPSRASAFC